MNKISATEFEKMMNDPRVWGRSNIKFVKGANLFYYDQLGMLNDRHKDRYYNERLINYLKTKGYTFGPGPAGHTNFTNLEGITDPSGFISGPNHPFTIDTINGKNYIINCEVSLFNTDKASEMCRIEYYNRGCDIETNPDKLRTCSTLKDKADKNNTIKYMYTDKPIKLWQNKPINKEIFNSKKNLLSRKINAVFPSDFYDYYIDGYLRQKEDERRSAYKTVVKSIKPLPRMLYNDVVKSINERGKREFSRRRRRSRRKV